ncbi:hypothetical protein BJV77DRAFT_1052975 [Russula vinacea]|nr:hypothetical protein BJV77DRAFT_1052975 [Russula vinacea]
MVALRIHLMHITQRVSAHSSQRCHPASTSHGRFTSTSNRTLSMRNPCPCPLDPRTSESVPDGSPRTHAPGPHARTPYPHARTHCIPCTRIRVRWMHHVCIPRLYVLM